MAAHYRADKAGFAKEVQEKLNQKYDGAEAAKVIRWICLLPQPNNLPAPVTDAFNKLPKTATSVDMNTFTDCLSDGMVLGYLMACLDKSVTNSLNSVKTWQKSNMPAFETSRQRDRIGLFLAFMTKYGVSSSFQFQTDQLYEKTDPTQVIISLQQVGVEAQTKPDYNGPKDYWMHKHKGNKREFTQEQLRSGDTVIGLQMGTNQGANASGMSFGSRRHITDSF